MARKLFCQISPLTYKISVYKCQKLRSIKDIFSKANFAKDKQKEPLEFLVYAHNSLIRRRLGNVDMELQENKAVNLSLAAPKVTNVLIKPGQTFSFWRLVGSTHKKYGYKEGLQISNGKVSAGVGGGMCQFTNLIHWIVCHTPLKIIEHHHHDRFDLFPDFNRQVPFGMGTSIFNNYLDYRFFNPTDTTFQLITYVKDEYLCAQMRSDKPTKYSYHIKAENERFEKKGEQCYRLGEVYGTVVDKRSGNIIKKELLRKNNALVMYKLENND